MLEPEAFAAVESLAAVAFAAFYAEDSRAVLLFAAGVVRMLLQKFICLKLFEFADSLGVEELVDGKSFVEGSLASFLETAGFCEVAGLGCDVTDRTVLAETMRTLGYRVELNMISFADCAP
jgi:hypothetical protein